MKFNRKTGCCGKKSILYLVVALTTEAASQHGTILVKEVLPFFFFNQPGLFQAAGDTDPFVTFIRLK